ncbi:MAG: hypothetical protein IJH12_11065 [Clostridia bacterium]|nr:hypothetical protein [Clostridia bacterium]
MKSSFLENLVEDNKSKTENQGIKNIGAINLSDIIEYVKGGISDQDFKNICTDINSGKINIGMDANSVNILLANKGNSQVQKLFQVAKMPKIDIDINSISEFSKENFQAIKAMGVNIGKVYVNSGWDEAAARGYTPNVYEKIVGNAEAMVTKAKSDLAKKNPGKDFEHMSERDKFMAIYNMVIKRAKYNYAAVDSKGESQYTSRNLQDFFCKGGSGVCAGFADSLVQLGKMCGLEIEYVQGDSKSKNMSHSEYHAWVRVKIDGKWYNADPTWDANHVKGKYGYCLKSDAEFDGHTLDTRYNPSYRRDSKGRLIDSRGSGTRDYEGSYYSYDSSKLADEYYTDDMGRRMKGFRNLTDEQAASLNSQYIPNAPSSVGTLSGNNFLTVILNFLIKITSFPAKATKKLKEKFFAGKLDASKLSGSDSNNYLKEEAEKEGAFDEIQVDPEKAQSYKDNKTQDVQQPPTRGDENEKER